MSEETKKIVCKRCGFEKDISSFRSNKRKCKDCVNEYKKGRYERRKKRFAALSEDEKFPLYNRVCSRCKVEKTYDMFSRTCVGYHASCKECENKESKERRWKGRVDTRHLPKPEAKSRICTGCKVEKLFDFFNKCSTTKYGVAERCKECRSQAAKKAKLLKKLETEELKNLFPPKVETHKNCSYCKNNKEILAFRFNSQTGKYGTKCSECVQKHKENRVGKSQNFNEPRKVAISFAEYLINNPFILCKRCGIPKDVSFFEIDVKKPYDKRSRNCKECLIEVKKIEYENKKKSFLLKHENKEELKISKTCSVCNIERDISLFKGYRYGILYYRNNCKICKDNAGKIYRAKNREKILAKNKEYHCKNREEINKRSKMFREQNKEKLSIKNKEYRIKGRARIAAWHKNKRKTNLEFKLLCNLRNRVYCALKGFSKSAKTLDLLGCSVEFLRNHLESQFEPEMSWDNYGLDGWSVDHIVPCASFNLEKEEEQRKCFHFSNLMPRWTTTSIAKLHESDRIGNINKSDKIIGVDFHETLL